jgi:hypothetical protein
LIGLGSWMSTTPDGTPLLFPDLRAAEIYAVNGDLPQTFSRGWNFSTFAAHLIEQDLF